MVKHPRSSEHSWAAVTSPHFTKEAAEARTLSSMPGFMKLLNRMALFVLSKSTCFHNCMNLATNSVNLSLGRRNTQNCLCAKLRKTFM